MDEFVKYSLAIHKRDQRINSSRVFFYIEIDYELMNFVINVTKCFPYLFPSQN